MKKWIPAVTLACSVAVGQIAAAEQRHDRNSGHAELHYYGSQIHHLSTQANNYDRVVIGGYSRNVHDKGHHRRQQHRRRHDRHRNDSQRAYERRHHGDSHYDHGYSNPQRRGNNRHGHHDRHHDSRQERRISRVIRAY